MRNLARKLDGKENFVYDELKLLFEESISNLRRRKTERYGFLSTKIYGSSRKLLNYLESEKNAEKKENQNTHHNPTSTT